METWEVILLGIIQGLTEFLPVSSSGHLILAPRMFGFEDQGLAMDAVLHLGTLLSIIIFFYRDLWHLFVGLLPGARDAAHRRLAWSIVAASFPAGLLGLALSHWIEENLRSAQFVAGNLLFWSLILWWAHHKSRHQEGSEDLFQLTWGQVFFIGCAQAMALFPGTSRSGVTLAAGIFSGLRPTAAARFSFLLGTPIILAAGLLKTYEFLTAPADLYRFDSGQLLTGFLVSFGVGYLAIRLLLEVLGKVGLAPFIWYRVLLAAVILWQMG